MPKQTVNTDTDLVLSEADLRAAALTPDGSTFTEADWEDMAVCLRAYGRMLTARSIVRGNTDLEKLALARTLELSDRIRAGER